VIDPEREEPAKGCFLDAVVCVSLFLQSARTPHPRREHPVGHFLKAAYEILSKEGRPLSAKEIVDLAVSDGRLTSAGKTPWQTMKAKLSTEILNRGAESPFMRAEKGRFALRQWRTVMKEHVAERFQKALFDEDIVVFPSGSLQKYIPGPGLYTGRFDSASLISECRSMRRREAEGTFDFIQLVSVFVVRYGEKYLTYKRTKRLPESRLHDFYSFSFGGHLNPSDIKPLLNIFDPGLATPLLLRELGEELKLERGRAPELAYRGLLYDTSREVSRQHIGVTYDVFLPTDRYEIGERGFLMDPRFETLDQILVRKADFENWSVLLIDEELRRRERTWAMTSSLF
jgi:predicted NUDIX family phosphoesterase